MPNKLNLPLDSGTVEGLRNLGRDLVKSKNKRAAFLKDPNRVMKDYGVRDIDPSRLDQQVIQMLADPQFAEAVQKGDIQGIREFVHKSLADRIPTRATVGTIFDFDFDVEFEVEIVAVAIAVFDFAAAKAPQPTEAELMRRRQIVANAFEALGKKLPT